MAQLKTDYKDQLLDTSVNTQRKYRMITNDDGTVSFEDATVYLQSGDTFGAAELNEIASQLLGGGTKIRYNEQADAIEVLLGGEWVEWKKAGFKERYLFLQGNEYTAETGGFVKYNGQGTIANDGSVLNITGFQDLGGETTYFGSAYEIDLSNTTTIEVVFSADLTKGSYNEFSIGVSSEKGGDFTVVGKYTWNNAYTDELLILDVSNVEKGYIQFKEQSGYVTTASIKSIKLV